MRPQKVKTRPSSADLWIPCPGSAWVKMAVDAQPVTFDKNGKAILAPGQAPGPYAAEGTMAHAILSHKLTGKPISAFLRKEDAVLDLPAEDIDLIETMAEVVKGLMILNGFAMHVETLMSLKFDIELDKNTRQVHTIWGKADVILVNDTQIMVLDYKHGAGKPVNVERNPQLTLYGMMALERYPGRQLTIGVIQPRGRGRGVDLWDCPIEYLNTFNKTVKAALRKVYDPFPSFNPGPWCENFCEGKKLGVCPVYLERALRYAVGIQGAPKETLAAAWWLLDWVDSAAAVSKKLHEEALKFAQRGGRVPGWSLGRKNCRGRWRDPGEIAEVLGELAGVPSEQFIKPPEPVKPTPIGITEAKRHPRLKGQNLDKYIFKPTTEILVKETETLELFDEVEVEKERNQ